VRRMPLVAMVCLLLMGCRAHTVEENPFEEDTPSRSEALPVPPASLPTAVQEELRLAATPAPRLHPVLPTLAEDEGLLVGTVTMPTDEAELSCVWLDARLRNPSAPRKESLTQETPAHTLFNTKRLTGNTFAFALPAGKYALFSARVECNRGDGSPPFKLETSEFSNSPFEVTQGAVTYFGSISFTAQSSAGARSAVNLSASGPSFIIENRWARDSRLFEQRFPLVDWTQTARSLLLWDLKSLPDDSPRPERLGRLLQQPIEALPKTSRRSKQTVAWAASAAELEQACERGAAEACFKRGILLLDEGVATSESRAPSFFAKACGGGIASGCFNLATLSFQGRGMASPNLSRAVGLFQRSCQQGLELGCFSLGVMYEEGLGGVYLSQDVKQAIRLYEQVCTNGEAEGCFALGLIYARGKGVIRDPARALTLFEKSCTSGHPRACLAAAQLKEQAMEK